MWIDKEGRKLESWSILVKKAVKTEAKAKIQTSISRDTNQHYHWGNRPIHTIAAKINPQPQIKKNL